MDHSTGDERLTSALQRLARALVASHAADTEVHHAVTAALETPGLPAEVAHLIEALVLAREGGQPAKPGTWPVASDH